MIYRRCTFIVLVALSFNLSVESALKEISLTNAIACCQNVFTHFHQSRLDQEALTANCKQQLLELPKYSLIQDVSTGWNSIHDMIKRACKRQPAIAAVLYQRRDLSHLEQHSSSEWKLLENIIEVLVWVGSRRWVKASRRTQTAVLCVQ